MKKLEFIKREFSYDVLIDDHRVDSCHESQFAFIMRKYFGANVDAFMVDNDHKEVVEARHEYAEYWSDDDELMDERYRHLCTGVTGDIDWNLALAEKQGYHYFKKLVAKDFDKLFATRVSIARALLDIAPEREEIMQILNLQAIV